MLPPSMLPHHDSGMGRPVAARATATASTTTSSLSLLSSLSPLYLPGNHEPPQMDPKDIADAAHLDILEPSNAVYNIVSF